VPKFNPDRTTLSWLYNEYREIPPSEAPLECTLKPGQVCAACEAGVEMNQCIEPKLRGVKPVDELSVCFAAIASATS